MAANLKISQSIFCSVVGVFCLDHFDLQHVSRCFICRLYLDPNSKIRTLCLGITRHKWGIHLHLDVIIKIYHTETINMAYFFAFIFICDFLYVSFFNQFNSICCNLYECLCLNLSNNLKMDFIVNWKMKYNMKKKENHFGFFLLLISVKCVPQFMLLFSNYCMYR